MSLTFRLILVPFSMFLFSSCYYLGTIGDPALEGAVTEFCDRSTYECRSQGSPCDLRPYVYNDNYDTPWLYESCQMIEAGWEFEINSLESFTCQGGCFIQISGLIGNTDLGEDDGTRNRTMRCHLGGNEPVPDETGDLCMPNDLIEFHLVETSTRLYKPELNSSFTCLGQANTTCDDRWKG